jgi:hypothetical protein
LETHRLICHADAPPLAVTGVSVNWTELTDGRLMLRYRVDGCGQLAVPEFAGVGRGEGLWQATCFELFLLDTGGTYREFNFSPSQRWAAYHFASYREGRNDGELIAAPAIASQRGDRIFTCTVFLDSRELRGATRTGISSVIEETGGTRSYWALAHPPGKPDFHHPDCFARTLPAPGGR